MRPEESFIAQPIRSLQTMLRVIAEDNTQHPTVVPDGIYGPTTTNAIAAFQRLYSIPVTGITDQNTWEQIVDAYKSARIRIGKAEPIEILLEPGQIIRFGQRNPYVYLLQGMLAYISEVDTQIPQPTASGIMDEETVASVLAFQKVSGLEESGNLDRITWLYLANLFTLNVHARENRAQNLTNV